MRRKTTNTVMAATAGGMIGAFAGTGASALELEVAGKHPLPPEVSVNPANPDLAVLQEIAADPANKDLSPPQVLDKVESRKSHRDVIIKARGNLEGERMIEGTGAGVLLGAASSLAFAARRRRNEPDGEPELS